MPLGGSNSNMVETFHLSKWRHRVTTLDSLTLDSVLLQMLMPRVQHLPLTVNQRLTFIALHTMPVVSAEQIRTFLPLLPLDPFISIFLAAV